MPRTPDPGASESIQRVSVQGKQKAKLQIRTNMQKKAAFPFRLKTTVPGGGIYGRKGFAVQDPGGHFITFAAPVAAPQH
jgi:hypothetical protein